MSNENSALNLLPAAAIVGLSKMVGTSTKAYKGARAELAPGSEHTGQATITFDYDLRVGDEEEYTPTIKIGQLPVMALALRKAGFMGPEILKYVTEAAREIATSEGSLNGELASDVADLEEAIDQVRNALSEALPKRTRNGKILGKAHVTGVMVSDEDAEA